MNENLKRFIYTMGTIFIICLVAKLFFKMLPLLLLVGLISYIVIKTRSFIKSKKEQSSTNDTINNNNYNNKGNYENSDDYTGEVIDVDYEEVDQRNN